MSGGSDCSDCSDGGDGGAGRCGCRRLRPEEEPNKTHGRRLLLRGRCVSVVVDGRVCVCVCAANSSPSSSSSSSSSSSPRPPEKDWLKLRTRTLSFSLSLCLCVSVCLCSGFRHAHREREVAATARETKQQHLALSIHPANVDAHAAVVVFHGTSGARKGKRAPVYKTGKGREDLPRPPKKAPEKRAF